MRISDWSSDVCSSDLISNAVMAGVQGGSITIDGDVTISATEAATLGGGALGVGVGLGQAMFAGAGSVQVNRMNSAVAAYVLPVYDGDGIPVGQVSIDAGSLGLLASDDSTLVAVTGGVAVTKGGSAAVGAAGRYNRSEG